MENNDNFLTTNVRFIGNVINDATDKELQRDDFDFSPKLFETLHSRFGIKRFRPNQLQSWEQSAREKGKYPEDTRSQQRYRDSHHVTKTRGTPQP